MKIQRNYGMMRFSLVWIMPIGMQMRPDSVSIVMSTRSVVKQLLLTIIITHGSLIFVVFTFQYTCIKIMWNLNINKEVQTF